MKLRHRYRNIARLLCTAAVLCFICAGTACSVAQDPVSSPVLTENSVIITPKNIDAAGTPEAATPAPETPAATQTLPTGETDKIIDALAATHAESWTETVFTAVQTEGSNCNFSAYVYRDGSWAQEFNCSGFVGKNGLAEGDKEEGDGKTPAGVYALGQSFGINDAPSGAPFDYIKVTASLYWDCDVRSLYYNQLVDAADMPSAWDRNASERLANYPGSYDYAVEIRYNTDPVVAGKGSAIFLHCTRENSYSTAGCVAIPETYMEKVLTLLTDRSCIVISRDTGTLAGYLADAANDTPFEPHTNPALPEYFTYITDLIPNAVVDIRYFGTYNFMGRRADGYEANVAISTKALAEKLYIAAQQLYADGYRLIIYDAYRPKQAVADFIAWGQDPDDTSMKEYFYPDLTKEELFSYGYISSRSRHSRGSAVDLSIVTLDGTPVDMGGTFDFFGPVSHHDAEGISSEAAANRAYLKSVMENAGLTAINSEWWHYYLKDEPFTETYFDFPVR